MPEDDPGSMSIGGGPEAAVAIRAGAEDATRINRLTSTAQIVPGVCHDLNNSLQVIGGIVELLSVRADLPADVTAKIDRIGVHTRRAAAVVREIGAYARSEVQGAAFVSLAKTVEAVVALRGYALARAGISLKIEDLAGSAGVVRGEPQQLQQALVNLLLNAEQAVSGRPSAWIRIEIVRNDDRVRLAISDSGPGVSEPLRQRIFEPFFTTREHDGALGLGLTAAAWILQQHAGRILIEAASEGGARFEVDLPAA